MTIRFGFLSQSACTVLTGIGGLGILAGFILLVFFNINIISDVVIIFALNTILMTLGSPLKIYNKLTTVIIDYVFAVALLINFPFYPIIGCLGLILVPTIYLRRELEKHPNNQNN